MAVASGTRPEQNGGCGTLCALFSHFAIDFRFPLISCNYIYIVIICRRQFYTETLRPNEMLHVRNARERACDNNNNINPRGKRENTYVPLYININIYIVITYVVAEYYEYYIIILKGFLFFSFLSPLFALF